MFVRFVAQFQQDCSCFSSALPVALSSTAASFQPPSAARVFVVQPKLPSLLERARFYKVFTPGRELHHFIDLRKSSLCKVLLVVTSRIFMLPPTVAHEPDVQCHAMPTCMLVVYLSGARYSLWVLTCPMC